MHDLRLYAYLVALAAVLLWFFFKERKISTGLLTTLFIFTAGFYLVFLLLGGGGLWHLLGVLARDLVILAAVAFIGFYFAESTWMFSIAVLILGLGIRYVYFDGTSPKTEEEATLESSAEETPSVEEMVSEAVPSPVTPDPLGELLVDVKAGSELSEISDLLAEHGGELSRAFPNLQYDEYSDLEEYYVVDIADDRSADLEAVIQALQATGWVDHVERNEMIELELPMTGAESLEDRNRPGLGVDDPRAGEQWGLGALDIKAFYAALDGVEVNGRATVAILDTGVDSGHEDLAANYTSTDSAFDVDRVGHGTHCAGVAAAVTGNGLGVASLSAPGNRFLTVTSIKVLNDFGSGSQQGVIRGMIRAADEGADVISMSLGGFAPDSRAAFEEAVEYANKAGAIVVASAGNDGIDASGYVPGGLASLITVTAVDANLSLARFSNHVQRVEKGVAAPGVDVLSTLPGNNYEALSGTSMAAPHVAGLVGLMKALDPELTTERAFQWLDETGAETNDTAKSGRLVQPAAVLAAMGY